MMVSATHMGLAIKHLKWIGIEWCLDYKNQTECPKTATGGQLVLTTTSWWTSHFYLHCHHSIHVTLILCWRQCNTMIPHWWAWRTRVGWKNEIVIDSVHSTICRFDNYWLLNWRNVWLKYLEIMSITPHPWRYCGQTRCRQQRGNRSPKRTTG